MPNAIITGTNRGIGKAILKKFVENGYNVWACARTKNEDFEKELKELAEKNNVWVEPVYFDLSSSDAIKTGFKQIWSSKKPIDVLVNNAGIAYIDLFQLTPEQKIREVFETNVFAVMTLTRLVLKVMGRQKRGSIVNISSIAALDAISRHSIYGASKAAIASFSRSLSAELSKLNIRVNVIAPGVIDTDMMSNIKSKSSGEDLFEHRAIKRLGTPNEVANLVLFLVSEEATYIQGQVIRIDGGTE